MLIDICNTYNISLDKLLNEDKKFVSKIDFYNKSKKIIKTGGIFVVVVLVIFLAVFIRWKIIANDMNETFAGNAEEIGFVSKSGSYVLEEKDISFHLPNQKLPFLKEDFFLKNSSAEFKLGDMEIGITIYDGDEATIEFNHYRYLKGTIDKNGKWKIEENILNDEEYKFYEENAVKFESVLNRLWKIHKAVYG